MRFCKRYFPALLAIVWMLVLAHRGLKEDFNLDDVMNLGVPFFRTAAVVMKGAVLFWTGYIRPMGALFYLAVYAVAGYWSLPFRIACFALIGLNLVLGYRLFLKLGPRPFAMLALLVVSFHAVLGDIYMSTGTVYDLLCQMFMLIALNWYAEEASWWRTVGIGVCALGAVDSKEVGVALPVLMAAYDLVVRRRTGNKIAGGTVLVVTGVFVWSRIFLPNELTANEGYRMMVTGQQYLTTTANYINLLLGTELGTWSSLGVLLLPLVPAALLRSRLMLFGWLYYAIALGPMSFTVPRAGYALYVPYTGIGILVAAFFYELKSWRALALGAAVVLVAQIRADRLWIKRAEHPWGHLPISALADGVSGKYASLPKGSRLLLVNDPFGKDEIYTPAFVLWLRYHDPTLYVRKLLWDRTSGRFVFPAEPFDHIFLFAGSATWEFTKHGKDGNEDFGMDGRPLPYVEMKSNEADLSIVKDVGGIGTGDPQRWVNQDPVMAFRVPRQPAKFRMDFEVPDVILKTTGPLKIHCWIAEQPAPDLAVSKFGRRRYEAPLPAGLNRGDVVQVRFHIENPYVSKTDGARLSFLLWAAGFVGE